MEKSRTNTDIDCIILAGGKGTRLQPYYPDIPKCLVKVNGRSIIERQIDKLKSHFNKIVVSAGHLSEELPNLNAKVIIEKELLGTAGAVKYALDYTTTERVFIVNADDMSNIDIDGLISIDGNIICLSNFKCPFGVVYTSGDKVISFQEKPLLKDVWVSMGHYLLKREDLITYLPDRGSIETDVLPEMDLKAYKHRGWWVTVNDKKQLDEANEFFRRMENESRDDASDTK